MEEYRLTPYIAECENSSADTHAIAWMWLLLGCTIFINKSGCQIKPSCLLEIKDILDGVEKYSLGSANLALYRQLGVASVGPNKIRIT
ncbi:hypothetical protein M5689_024735 [Euphorbia peplus]|nr:hypothetical protein M5689_024735 [Euphorbia peplus]